MLDTYLDKPAGVLALVGPDGSGKKHLSKIIAEKLLNSPYEQAVNRGSILVVVAAEDKKEISIESVRELISSLSLKTSSPDDRRIVIINDVQNLSLEGQNALLKTLEQPSKNTHFILSMPQSSSVLPTMLSRTTQISVKPVDIGAALKHFASTSTESEIRSAWALGKGLPGQMHKLLMNESSELGDSVKAAKKFLALNKYERLLLLDDYSKNKGKFAYFLIGLSRVLEAAHRGSIEKNNVALARRLSASRSSTYKLTEQLNLNTSVKLTALQLVNSLKV